MSEIKAIEKLRSIWRQLPVLTHSDELLLADMDACIKAIEAEVAERYMLLPVDADGVSIHVGDVMEQNGKRIGTVTAVGKHAKARAWVLPDGKNVSVSYIASGISHVKQRTLEDVLADFAKEVNVIHSGFISSDGEKAYMLAAIKETADEIRELLGGDA